LQTPVLYNSTALSRRKYVVHINYIL